MEAITAQFLWNSTFHRAPKQTKKYNFEASKRQNKTKGSRVNKVVKMKIQRRKVKHVGASPILQNQKMKIKFKEKRRKKREEKARNLQSENN